MKTILSSSYTVFISVLIGWLIAGCTHKSNEAAPQGTCRIQLYTATTRSQFSNAGNQTTYTYDQAGNLSKIMATWSKEPINGAIGSQTTTTANTYVYDANNYLTSSTEQMVTITVFNGRTTEDRAVTNSSYSYTNSRLTTRTDQKTVSYAPSSNGTFTTKYDYDSSGNLTKITTGNDSWLYQNNQLIGHGNLVSNQGSISYVIQNGVITKMVIPGDSEFIGTGTFDEQQRLTKHDEYINGQLNRSTFQTWTNAKPSSASLPQFKGFPVIVPVSAFSGKAGVLATYKQTYWNSVRNTMETFNEDTYTVQTNEQGFITGATIVSKHPFATDQDYTTTETYTYSGCQ